MMFKGNRLEGNYDGEYKRAFLGFSKVFHGTGTFTFTDGSLYTGRWEDGKRSGHGVMKWPNGQEYDGEWKDDQCHGSGKADL